MIIEWVLVVCLVSVSLCFASVSFLCFCVSFLLVCTHTFKTHQTMSCRLAIKKAHSSSGKAPRKAPIQEEEEEEEEQKPKVHKTQPKYKQLPPPDEDHHNRYTIFYPDGTTKKCTRVNHHKMPIEIMEEIVQGKIHFVRCRNNHYVLVVNKDQKSLRLDFNETVEHLSYRKLKGIVIQLHHRLSPSHL